MSTKNFPSTLSSLNSELKYHSYFTPEEWQSEGILFQLIHKYVINGDKMGLGKTFQAIATLLISDRPCFIVVPAHLKYNWEEEWQKISAMGVPDWNIHILSYSSLSSKKCIIRDYFDLKGKCDFVFDEAHYLKNIEAQRTKHAHYFVRKMKPEHCILLTGTPMKRSVDDWFSLLLMMSYCKSDNGRKITEVAKDIDQFRRKFMEKKLKKYKKRGRYCTAWEFYGAKNDKLFRTFLDKKYIRREDVLNIPMVEKTIVFKNLINGTELEKAWKDFCSGKRGEHISKTKAETALRKSEGTKKYLLDLLEEEVGPIVVFSDHIASIQNLGDYFMETEYSFAVIRGGVKADTRKIINRQFQDGELDMIFLTIGAGATGLNLFRANHTVFNDLSWDIEENRQACYRTARKGQEKTCHYHFISGGLVDNKIKAKVASFKEIAEKFT
jgi:SNF2 family DNA or RNA helicase